MEEPTYAQLALSGKMSRALWLLSSWTHWSLGANELWEVRQKGESVKVDTVTAAPGQRRNWSCSEKAIESPHIFMNTIFNFCLCSSTL